MRFERNLGGLLPIICLAALPAVTFVGRAETVRSQGPPGGRVIEGLSLESGLLGSEVRYGVYLPPDYDTSGRRYPVLYLLHGFSDQEWAWIQFGQVHVAADQGILSGEVPAMIVVMPDGGVTWYVDDHSGGVPYRRMFVEELIPHVDRTYRTRTSREFRAVSGLSMGGYGALMLAMRHPDLFSACVAFSSGVMTDEEVVAMDAERWDRVLSEPFGHGLVGEERLTDQWKAHSPLHLARTLAVEELRRVRWYLDCGDDDFLYRGNAMLHILLREREIPHEYRVRDGGHVWEYWRTGIRDGLRFLGRGFHR
jgi:enterochelin esterase-like enzyme